jgi:hypothetical protein
LVAHPGVARKSQALTFGMEFLTVVPDITISAESATKEALMVDLESAVIQSMMPDGTQLNHSSLSIFSKEFETFLGQKKENTKMLVLLTDLFDAQEKSYKYRTKHSGSNEIQSVFVNLIAATTPDSLASSLPSTAIGGGLTSRILFVWADRKYKKKARPVKTPEEKVLQEKLKKDLFKISQMSGEMMMTPEAEKNWDAWYEQYEELDPGRICLDPSFDGWYSRKPTYILKLSMICAASKSSALVIEWGHIVEAIAHIEEIEYSMGNVFRAIGKSGISAEVETIISIVSARGIIHQDELFRIVFRDMDWEKMKLVLETAYRAGKIKRGFDGKSTWWLSTKYNRVDILDKLQVDKRSWEQKVRLIE